MGSANDLSVSQIVHAPHTLSSSEFYLQSELDVPRAKGPRRPSEVGTVCVAYRPIQIHPVEEVEEFCPEDEVGSFLPDEPGNLGLLRENEVGVGVSGTWEGVAPQIPQKIIKRIEMIIFRIGKCTLII